MCYRGKHPAAQDRKSPRYRWVVFSYSAVKAVWVDFAALLAHFDKQSSNLQLDRKERSTFSGLRKTLCGFTFIKNLAIMCNALEELAHLSESLQQASASLPKAHRLITREIEILKSPL